MLLYLQLCAHNHSENSHNLMVYNGWIELVYRLMQSKCDTMI